MNRNRNLTGSVVLAMLFLVLGLATAALYVSAKELLINIKTTCAEAEDLFTATEILHTRAEATQEVADEAKHTQPISVKEYEIETITWVTEAGEDTSAFTDETPTVEPEAQQVSLGNYVITAYCPCEICCGYWATTRPLDENGEPIVYTASGARAEAGVTIAVDTAVIPHGTRVWFEGPDGVQEYTAQDTGGAVNGNHIDLYFDCHEAALAWGTQTREVFRKAGA